MPRKRPLILIVEDNAAASFGYDRFLTGAGYESRIAATLEAATHAAETEAFDAVLLDLRLPDGNALQWLPSFKALHPHAPVIVITGMNDIPTAVQATKNGAEYFLTKPIEMPAMKESLDKCLEMELLRRRNMVQQRLSENEEQFFGDSRPMLELMEYASVAAANDSVALLLGETGVGKGVLARWIHRAGPRKAEAFVELNCSSLKGELLRSELFGHVKGAFTSAVKDRLGLIEVADNGTLFLDEIGDMDLEVQAQLLKTIEEKSFRRIGENLVRKSDFRLICATNRDIVKEIDEKRFRKDLFYRICVFPISIPPLRDRLEDIPGLARHLLATLSAGDRTLSDEVVSLLLGYPWPGNVRELRNMIERALLLANGAPLTVRHFPGLSPAVPAAMEEILFTADPSAPLHTLTEVENAHIAHTVRRCGGDKLKAARLLGISLSSLYRRLQNIKQVE